MLILSMQALAFLSGWNYQREITIDSTVSSTLTQFPAYTKFDTAQAIIDAKLQADCDDIRITYQNDTIIPYEIEDCDASSTTVWFAPDSLPSGTQSYYLYYGNAGAAKAEDPLNVWDSNYGIVFHFDQDDGQLIAVDSSGHYNGTVYGAPLYIKNSSCAFSSCIWQENNTFLENVTFFSDLNTNTLTDYTITWWTVPDYVSGSNLLTGMVQTDYYLYMGSANSNWIFNVDSAASVQSGNYATNDGQLTPMAVKESSGTTYMYINGSIKATNGVVSNKNFNIWAVGGGSTTDFYSGAYDEYRQSLTARSSDWIGAVANMTSALGSESTGTGANIAFVAPTDTSSPLQNVQYFAVNVSANSTGGNVENVTITLYYSNLSIANQTIFLYGVSNETYSFLNYSGLANDLYYLNATMTDSNVLNDSTITINFTVDTELPAVITNYQNNSYYMFQNLEAQFNLSDNTILYAYNISIDGTMIQMAQPLNTSTYQVNFTYNVSALSAGQHRISIEVYDGHTALEIPEFAYTNGLFNDKLSYSWKAGNDNKAVNIEPVDGSIFDTFTTKKEIDRYTWKYEPSKQKTEYTFKVSAVDNIHIVNAEWTHYKKWLIIGDKWIDFEVENEEPTIQINKTKSNEVLVTVGNIKNPDSLHFHSIGNLNRIEYNYTFNKFNASVSAPTPVLEGFTVAMNLTLEMENISFKSIVNDLQYGSLDAGSGTQTNHSTEKVSFRNNVVVPYSVGNINYNWSFNFSDDPLQTTYTLSGDVQYLSINLTNCSTGTYYVLNYTVFDEDTKTLLEENTTTIESFIVLTNPQNQSISYNFSFIAYNSTASVCMPEGVLNSTSFILDTITSYVQSDHVQEYHYIVNYTLTNNSIPLDIDLYDLLSSRSTSFLVTYQDDNYLYIGDAIIDLQRQYISDNGTFFSVEHGRTDEGGQTLLHLVTEDVVYRFNIYKYGTLLYSTTEYLALCQTTPCQINLRKPFESSQTTSESENIVVSLTEPYNFSSNDIITLNYATTDGSPANLLFTVSEYSRYNTGTICNESTTSSSGSLNCAIGAVYENKSLYATVYKNDQLIAQKSYTTFPSSSGIFQTLSIILTALAYITLAFMGISSPQLSLVLGLIGLAMMGMVNLFSSGALLGIGSTFIYLIVAAAIIIYKIQQRRVN